MRSSKKITKPPPPSSFKNAQNDIIGRVFLRVAAPVAMREINNECVWSHELNVASSMLAR